jgi:hypothetical protein
MLLFDSSAALTPVKYPSRQRWTRLVARMEKMRGAYRILVGKPEEKKPLGKSRCRWEDTKWNLETWDGGMDWIDLAQDRNRWEAVVNTEVNFLGP